jgi:T-complex protein 1 subunit eta
LIKAFRIASALAVQRVRDLSVSLKGDLEEKKSLLKKCASTTLNSKLVRAGWPLWQPRRAAA